MPASKKHTTAPQKQMWLLLVGVHAWRFSFNSSHQYPAAEHNVLNLFLPCPSTFPPWSQQRKPPLQFTGMAESESTSQLSQEGRLSKQEKVHHDSTKGNRAAVSICVHEFMSFMLNTSQLPICIQGREGRKELRESRHGRSKEEGHKQ